MAKTSVSKQTSVHSRPAEDKGRSPRPAAAVESPPVGAPVVDVHPYSVNALNFPECFASQWLNAGPAFWVSPIGTWGIARYAETLAALRDWESYCSGRGNGIVDRSQNAAWRTPSALLDADPPEHTQNRGIVRKVLAGSTLRPRFDEWAARADALVEGLVAKGSFDAATDLATAYGHSIVPNEIGLVDHRPDLLFAYGVAGGNAQFPYGDLYVESNEDPRVAEAMRWVDESCERDHLESGGWGEAIHAAADQGHCSRSVAKLLVRSLITAGVENTILAIGNMVHAFAASPDQWETLRASPSLVRGAVEEVMRYDGPSFQFFRTAVRDVCAGDVTIPAGSKVLLLLGIANRDPRRWSDPNRFDIMRDTSGHLGFGFGPHQCIGQLVARQEMIVVLQALVKHVRHLRLKGKSVRRLNNTARGYASIPIEVVPA